MPDFHQFACQKAGSGGIERSRHEAVARPAGCEERLPDQQAFEVVPQDGDGDNPPARPGHQAPYPRKLPDLLELRLGRAGIDDGGKRPVGMQPGLKEVADGLGRVRPEFNQLPFAFLAGDHAGKVHLPDFQRLGMGLFQDGGLLWECLDIADGKADAGARGIVETERLQPVGEPGRLLRAVRAQAIRHELLHAFLCHGIVSKAQVFRERLVEQEAPERGFDAPAPSARRMGLLLLPLASRRILDGRVGQSHQDARVQVDHVVFRRQHRFGCTREDAPGAFRRGPHLRQVVEP